MEKNAARIASMGHFTYFDTVVVEILLYGKKFLVFFYKDAIGDWEKERYPVAALKFFIYTILSPYVLIFRIGQLFIHGKQSLNKSPSLEHFRVAGVVETGRTEEPLGNETRMIDNSDSNAQVTRTCIIERQWTKEVILDYEQMRSESDSRSVGIESSTILQKVTESSLRSKYSVRDKSSNTHREEVSIIVPQQTKVNVEFSWKRIYQHGCIELTGDKASFISIPFRVSIGVTFDQSQRKN